jgi:hypothetical protein
MNIGNPLSSLGNLNQKINSTSSQSPNTSPIADYTGWGAGISFLGQPFAFYLGLIAFLFLLKWFGEHPNTPIDPRHIHIGGYDMMAVGVSAIVFIVGAKLLLNRYPVMGLTQVINYA